MNTPTKEESTGAPDRPSRWVCPLFGISADGLENHEVLTLPRDAPLPPVQFSIRTIRDEDRERIRACLSNVPMTDLETHEFAAVIETNGPPVYGPEPDKTAGLTLITWGLSLWVPTVSVPFCFLMEGGPFPAGLSWTMHEPYTYAPPQKAKLPQGWYDSHSWLLPQIAACLPQVGTAMRRYYMAANRADFDDAILDHVVAIESLMCRTKGAELTYKCSTRAAIMLGSTPEEREKIRSTVVDLYDLRSKMVHGSSTKSMNKAINKLGGNALAASRSARDLARRALLFVLQHPEYLEEKVLVHMAINGRTV